MAAPLAEVVGVEYNWQGCEWIFDLLHALTGIQVGGWMAGLGPGGGGIDPFGGGPLPKWLKKFLDLLGVPTTPLDVATKVLPLPPTAFDNATDPPSLEERAEQCWLQWGKGNPLCTIPDTVYLPPVPWNPEVPPDGAAAPIPGFPQRRPGSCSRIPRPLYCK